MYYGTWNHPQPLPSVHHHRSQNESSPSKMMCPECRQVSIKAPMSQWGLFSRSILSCTAVELQWRVHTSTAAAGEQGEHSHAAWHPSHRHWLARSHTLFLWKQNNACLSGMLKLNVNTNWHNSGQQSLLFWMSIECCCDDICVSQWEGSLDTEESMRFFHVLWNVAESNKCEDAYLLTF